MTRLASNACALCGGLGMLIALTACGGRTGGLPPGSDTTMGSSQASGSVSGSNRPGASDASDTANDGGACGPPPPGCARAYSPAACPDGFICTPTSGAAGPPGCGSSVCDCDPQQGMWDCTLDCGGGMCVPASTAPDASCPSRQPKAGDPCLGIIACRYAAPCGAVIVECTASASYWAVAQTATCGAVCPPNEPKPGDACLVSGTCIYSTPCGSTDTVYCNGTRTQVIVHGTCPACPDTEPPPLSSCTVGSTCVYPNACGATDLAICPGQLGGQWMVVRSVCDADASDAR
jgi:hypothetical protein